MKVAKLTALILIIVLAASLFTVIAAADETRTGSVAITFSGGTYPSESDRTTNKGGGGSSVRDTDRITITDPQTPTGNVSIVDPDIPQSNLGVLPETGGDTLATMVLFMVGAVFLLTSATCGDKWRPVRAART